MAACYAAASNASPSPKNMTSITHSLPLRTCRKRPSLAALAAALLLALFLIPAFAAQPPTPADTEAMLTAARKQIDDIRKRVADETDDARRADLGHLLLEEARLSAGDTLEDPSAFIARVNRIALGG